MPKVRIARTSPAFQASASLIKLPGHCNRATCRDRFIIVDYLIVIRPVLAVSLASHCERCCSGDRRFTRDAVSVQFRVKDSNPRHALQRRRSYRWTNPDRCVVGPEGVEPSSQA